MRVRQVIVVGGGAAGFFAAITCAESSPRTRVTILERGSRFLDKVRISGGGRCNVTHACFDPQDLAVRYPRGGKALLGPFRKFSAADTVAWFESRGVRLKTEGDGRMFPVTDSSQTVMDCLMNSARAAGVTLQLNRPVESLVRRAGGGFDIAVTGVRSQLQCEPGERSLDRLGCDRLLLATGGCRAAAAGNLAVSLGHKIEPPVPSLFTFQIESPWLRALSGVSVENVEVSVPSMKLCERGPLLVTHWGVSGPAVLKLSAWGARRLHDAKYRFILHVNWLPDSNEELVLNELNARRQSHPARLVKNLPVTPLSVRLWEQIVQAAGISGETRWASLSRREAHALARHLVRSEFPVTGKSLNKEEFVTCGGVRLAEVDFKTLESRVCPGLFFAGELLDIDALTGGFNFQAAWTTGFIAGQSMAA